MTRIARHPPAPQYSLGVVKEPRLPAYLTSDGV